jgi:hypothetical protein
VREAWCWLEFIARPLKIFEQISLVVVVDRCDVSMLEGKKVNEKLDAMTSESPCGRLIFLRACQIAERASVIDACLSCFLDFVKRSIKPW